MATLICCANMPSFPRFYRWATGHPSVQASHGYQSKTSRGGRSRNLGADDTQELFSISQSARRGGTGGNSDIEKHEVYGIRTTISGSDRDL
jgi:hypothetical protein